MLFKLYFVVLITLIFGYGTGFQMTGTDYVDIIDYPYVVSVQIFGLHICGGAILNSTHIITAAQCIYGIFDPEFLSVRIGSSTLNYGGKIKEVEEIVVHPNYTVFDYIYFHNYDIGLIKLKEPLTESDNYTQIYLGDKELDIGTKVEVLSWRGFILKTLNILHLEIVHKPNDTTITNKMICAKSTDNIQRPTYLDRGTPLIYDGKLYGITSWGLKWWRSSKFSYYSNVVALRNFIEN